MVPGRSHVKTKAESSQKIVVNRGEMDWYFGVQRPKARRPTLKLVELDLGGDIGCRGTLAVGTKTLYGIKRVPQCSHIGSSV